MGHFLSGFKRAVRAVDRDKKSRQKPTGRSYLASETGQWLVACSPEKLWPLVSDLSSLFQYFDWPEAVFSVDRDGTYRAHSICDRRARSWRDQPTEWVRGRSWHYQRNFSAGPFKLISASLELAPQDEGTLVSIVVQFAPCGFFGRMLLSLGFGRRAIRTMAQFLEGIESRVKIGADNWQNFAGSGFQSEETKKLSVLLRRNSGHIEHTGFDHGAVSDLADVVTHLPKHIVRAMRPSQLAPALALDEVCTTELLLAALDADILDMRHRIYCSACKNMYAEYGKLYELPQHAVCDHCHAHFNVNMQNNCETIFQQRDLPAATGDFCVENPQDYPQTLLHLFVETGQKLRLPLELASGRYSVRLHESNREALLLMRGQGICVDVNRDGTVEMEADPAGTDTIYIFNRSPKKVLINIESCNLKQRVLRTSDLICMHAFHLLSRNEDRIITAPPKYGDAGIVCLRLTGIAALHRSAGENLAQRKITEFVRQLEDSARINYGSLFSPVSDRYMLVFPSGEIACHVAEQSRLLARKIFSHGDERMITLSGGVGSGPVEIRYRNGIIEFVGDLPGQVMRLAMQAQAGEIKWQDRSCQREHEDASSRKASA